MMSKFALPRRFTRFLRKGKVCILTWKFCDIFFLKKLNVFSLKGKVLCVPLWGQIWLPSQFKALPFAAEEPKCHNRRLGFEEGFVIKLKYSNYWFRHFSAKYVKKDMILLAPRLSLHYSTMLFLRQGYIEVLRGLGAPYYEQTNESDFEVCTHWKPC